LSTKKAFALHWTFSLRRAESIESIHPGFMSDFHCSLWSRTKDGSRSELGARLCNQRRLPGWSLIGARTASQCLLNWTAEWAAA